MRSALISWIGALRTTKVSTIGCRLHARELSHDLAIQRLVAVDLGALAATALVAATAGAGVDKADSNQDAVSELIDPAAIAAGGMGDRHAATFKPMQLAMVSPAEPCPGTPRIRLWEGLGQLSYPITTDSEMAQDTSTRDCAWPTRSTMRRRTGRSRRRRLDPAAPCASGARRSCSAPTSTRRWNRRRAAGVRRPDQRQGAGASARARALIDALATRYSPDPDADPPACAYADAMAAAHAHPDDQDIAVLFADALMNTSPWDYWELDGRTLKGRLGEASAALEGVLAAIPIIPARSTCTST